MSLIYLSVDYLHTLRSTSRTQTCVTKECCTNHVMGQCDKVQFPVMIMWGLFIARQKAVSHVSLFCWSCGRVNWCSRRLWTVFTQRSSRLFRLHRRRFHRSNRPNKQHNHNRSCFLQHIKVRTYFSNTHTEIWAENDIWPVSCYSCTTYKYLFI